MKIIIECTKEEKDEMLGGKCPDYFIEVDEFYKQCKTIFSCVACGGCYNNPNIEFKIVE